MPALPSRRLVGGQLDVQSKTLASSFSRPEWKRPPEYPSGLSCPMLGYPAADRRVGLALLACIVWVAKLTAPMFDRAFSWSIPGLQRNPRDPRTHRRSRVRRGSALGID
jgi:hypothetical protein